ncbi:MAG: sulfotransferase [Rhodospirillales bacterium]|jgi:hypothetical protein|nr:sulfotransferase [Rhodospirillales bacterium]
MRFLGKIEQNAMDSFFYCVGLPKSGTTFLQRTLNLHPQISCPSEHNLEQLKTALGQAYIQYNETLDIVDRRTGGQGAKHVDVPALKKTLKAAILAIAESAGQGKPVCGLSDNSILAHLPFYSELLDHPPIIFIIRNPIDQSLSAWRHNHRLAKEENNREHVEIMYQHGETVESWLIYCAHLFNTMVNKLTQIIKTHDNVLLVRYEALVDNKASELNRIIEKLGGDTNSIIIDSIVQDSSLKQMSESSTHVDFFGEGSTELGGENISEELRKEILAICAPAMKEIGYSIED